MTTAPERPPPTEREDPVEAAVRRAVAAAPPLSREQRDRIGVLIAPADVPAPRQPSARARRTKSA